MKKLTLIFFSILVLSLQAQDGSFNSEINDGNLLNHPVDSPLDYAEKIDDTWMSSLYDSPLYNSGYKAVKNEKLTTTLLKERLQHLDDKTPFEVEYNATLERFIRLYLQTRKGEFSNLMDKAQYYFPIFEEHLDKYDLPLEIKYLAIVESALEPGARSVVGAKGLWQFMYHTGKQFGLKVNSYVDERADPVKATEAACKYLLSLYNTFGDWDLALAAYNSGPGNVSKAIRRSGGLRNYWNIRRYLPSETRSYVPAFYATYYIFEYGEEHNIRAKNMNITYFETDTILVKQKLSFAKIKKETGIDHALLKKLNPQYKLETIPFNENTQYYLTLPKSLISQFVKNENKIYGLPEQKPGKREASRSTMPNETNCHIVQQADNLSKIAKMYSLSLEDLKRLNGLETNYLIAGQCLVISKSSNLPIKNRPENDENIKNEVFLRPRADFAEKKHKIVTVKQGESLFMISKRFSDVSINQIRNWNNIWGVSYLKPGTQLKILTNY